MPTYRQLKQQIAQLQQRAAVAMKAEIPNVIEAIKRQIAAFGLTAADLGLAPPGVPRKGTRSAKKRTLPPKYRDPNSEKTWSGHGKRPDWFVAAQEKGRANALLIDPAPANAVPQAKADAKTKAARRKPSAPQGKRAAKPSVERTQKKVAAKPAAKKPAKEPAARVQKKAAAAKAQGAKAAVAKRLAKRARKAPVRAATSVSSATPEVAGPAS